jgi:hypothetical protein
MFLFVLTRKSILGCVSKEIVLSASPQVLTTTNLNFPKKRVSNHKWKTDGKKKGDGNFQKRELV